MTDLNLPTINARPRVRIENEMRLDMNSALLAMHINLPLSGAAHAELRFVNWRSNSADGDADFAFQDVAHGQRLEVLAGENDNAPLFAGEITALEERYGQGAPQLVLLAEDKLHRLARARHNRSFEEMSVTDVVNSVAGDLGLETDVQVSDVQGTWHQLNESNLAFLLRLLGPYDIALRIEGDKLRARAEEPDAELQTLHPQNNVQRLRILADLNHQPTAAEVKGHDLSSGDGTEGSDDTAVGSDSGAADLLRELSWGQAEIFPQPFARTQMEAQAWAEGRFRHRAKRFLYGDITCTGIPDLRAGREVKLEGVSARLQGTYQVVDCEHRFDNRDGYVTRIKVQRGGWSG